MKNKLIKLFSGLFLIVIAMIAFNNDSISKEYMSGSEDCVFCEAAAVVGNCVYYECYPCNCIYVECQGGGPGEFSCFPGGPET